MTRRAIICVDDEPIILLSLKRELAKRFGNEFIYESAIDAMDALQLIDEMIHEGADIAMIISDWLMPVMKGDEFLHQVNEKYPGIKGIIISGQADDDSISKAKERCNLTAFISKPYDPNTLFNVIEQNTALNS